MNKVDLHVIMRTSANAQIRPWKRIIDVPRTELVFKSLKSLINTINELNEEIVDIRLTILDDHSSEENLNKIREIASTCNRPFEIVSLEETGANNSSLKQFECAANSEGLVYMVEDDYFHSTTALRQMLDAWFYFRQRSDLLDVCVYPYDSTHLYEPENKGIHDVTRVYQINGHYWRTTVKTAYTMFTHSAVLKKYWFLFETLATKFPEVAEDQTINRLYNNGVDVGGPVMCFSPMPSLAVHVSYSMPNIMSTNFIDWVSEFEKLEV